MQRFVPFLLLSGCSLNFGELVDGTGGSVTGATTTSTDATSSAAGGSASGGMTSSSATGAGGSGGAGEFCGDGTINGAEQCDDGNTANGDGCANDCAVRCEDYSATAVKDPVTHDCYDAVLMSISYDECSTACFAIGPYWHLASLISAGEIAAAQPLAADGWRFVGAKRLTNGGTDWAWDSLPNMTFDVPWAAGEPVDDRLDGNMNTVAANCVALMENGLFNARPCGWGLPCLCEGDPPQLNLPD